MRAPPLAIFHPPNLTPAHLGSWSDGELVRAIREGVAKDDRALILMPSDNFKNLSDADVESIVAYLRSLPAVPRETAPHEIMPLGMVLVGTGRVPLSNQPPVRDVQAPARGPTADYGRYLTSIADCRNCHGENLDGQNIRPGPPKGPSLRVIKGWSEDQFMRVFREGVDPGGHVLSDEMPWRAYGQAAPDDLRAVYHYMRTLE